MSYKTGSASDWPDDMEHVCSNCPARGTEENANIDALCRNTNSTRYNERVGYHGTGCEQFQYPTRNSGGAKYVPPYWLS